MSLCAVVGSVFQFLAVYLDRGLQNASNLFILSLGCSDLIVGVWTLPSIGISVYHRSWVLSAPVCLFSAFVDSVAITASLWTLGFTALDRCLLVKSPVYYKSQMNQRKALQIVGFVWGLATVGATPPLLGWSGYGFSPFSMSCAMSSSGGFQDLHKYYFLFYVLLSFPAPLAMIVVSYYSIGRFVLSSRYNTKGHIAPYNLRTAKITLILTLFVLGCILPTFVIGLIFWCGYSIPFSQRTSKIVIWGLLGNSAVNPFLYGWLNTQFRTVYVRMCWCVVLRKKYTLLKRSAFSGAMLSPALRRSPAIRPVVKRDPASRAILGGWTHPQFFQQHNI